MLFVDSDEREPVSQPKATSQYATQYMQEPPTAQEPTAAQSEEGEGSLAEGYGDLLEELTESGARELPMPSYYLNVLYLDNAIGMAVDQQLASGERGPVTDYFWWPENDAWDSLNEELKTMPWLDQQQVISLLNTATDIINYWQTDDSRPTLEEARQEFPNVTFFGA